MAIEEYPLAPEFGQGPDVEEEIRQLEEALPPGEETDQLIARLRRMNEPDPGMPLGETIGEITGILDRLPDLGAEMADSDLALLRALSSRVHVSYAAVLRPSRDQVVSYGLLRRAIRVIDGLSPEIRTLEHSRQYIGRHIGVILAEHPGLEAEA